MARKKIFCLIFVLLLFLPVLLGILEGLTDINVDVQLNNVGTYEKPDLNVSSFFSGTYQKDFENWVSNSYAGRSFVIKTYNQMRFSLFQVSNLIVGRNHDLFQETYIQEYLGLDSKYNFADLSNRRNLEIYLDKLETVSQALEQDNKVLLLMLSPSKCDYNYENIPHKYENAYLEEYIRGIDYLRELLIKTNIHYIDSYNIISESNLECPVFYKSGIHWSRPIEQVVDARILDMIEEISHLKIKKFILTNLTDAEKPGYRDRDIWDLMNIWQNPSDIYYEYETETVVPANYMDLNILMQGGSFALGIREDFILNNICDDINYIFYNQYIFSMDGSQTEVSFKNNPDVSDSDWSNLDLEGLLNQSNVIIVELNAEHIYALNNGFIDLLYDYVINRKVSEGYFENLDFIGDYNMQSNFLSGIYGYEEDDDGKFAWTERKVSIELHNSRIYDKGLKLVMDIPAQNIGKDSKMVIKINNQVVQELILDSAERKEIIISPEALGKVDGDKITIDLECSVSFNPFMMGINNDDRELAVIIRYAGEVR